MNTSNKSEVARLRQEIELQLEAISRGMRGFATASTRHAFIRARMDRLDAYQSSLAKELGEEAADEMIYELYAGIMEK